MSNWNFFRLRMNINGETTPICYPLRGFGRSPISGSYNSETYDFRINEYSSDLSYITSSLLSSAFTSNADDTGNNDFYLHTYYSEDGTTYAHFDQWRSTNPGDFSSPTKIGTFKISSADLRTALGLSTGTFINDFFVLSGWLYIQHYAAGGSPYVAVSQIKITGSGIHTIDIDNADNQTILLGPKSGSNIAPGGIALGGEYTGSYGADGYGHWHSSIYATFSTDNSYDTTYIVRLPVTSSGFSYSNGFLHHTQSMIDNSSSFNAGNWGYGSTSATDIHAVPTFSDELGTLGANPQYVYRRKITSPYDVVFYKDSVSDGGETLPEPAFTLTSCSTSSYAPYTPGATKGYVASIGGPIVSFIDYSTVTFLDKNGNAGSNNISLTASFYPFTPSNRTFAPR